LVNIFHFARVVATFTIFADAGGWDRIVAGHAGPLLAMEQSKGTAGDTNREATLIKVECVAGVRLRREKARYLTSYFPLSTIWFH
jgi:hypothetical protein